MSEEVVNQILSKHYNIFLKDILKLLAEAKLTLSERRYWLRRLDNAYDILFPNWWLK